MFFKKNEKGDAEPLEMELAISNYPDVIAQEPTVNEMLKEILLRLEAIETKLQKK